MLKSINKLMMHYQSYGNKSTPFSELKNVDISSVEELQEQAICHHWWQKKI